MQLSPCTYTPSNLQCVTDCPTRRQLTAHITQLILLINYAQSISSQRITQYTIPGDHVSSTESNSSYLSDLHVNSPAKSCTEVCQSVNVSVFPFCPLRYEDKLVVAVPPESMELARCPNTMVFIADARHSYLNRESKVQMLQELPVIHFTFIFYLLGAIIGEVNVDRAYLQQLTQNLTPKRTCLWFPTRSEISSPTFLQLSLFARIPTTLA